IRGGSNADTASPRLSVTTRTYECDPTCRFEAGPDGSAAERLNVSMPLVPPAGTSSANSPSADSSTPPADDSTLASTGQGKTCGGAGKMGGGSAITAGAGASTTDSGGAAGTT